MNNYLYTQFARNEYSQFGEDGIIEQVLSLIPNKNDWCVEFGAWDGIHLSNTYNLIKNKGYRSVLIEANKKKFKVLQRNMTQFNSVLINEFVTFDGANTLDNILERTSIPEDFDFLSIDIDGNDYWIFESLSKFRPKIVCIEYNPTIPNEIDYIQPRNFAIQKGSSALSICKLAAQKSYELIATTRCNLIFIDRSLFYIFQLNDNELTFLRDDSDSKVYAFVCYDGTIVHSKPLHFLWHNFIVHEEELQSLPRFLRTFPSDYNIIKKIIFSLFMLFREPGRTILYLLAKIKKCFSSK